MLRVVLLLQLGEAGLQAAKAWLNGDFKEERAPWVALPDTGTGGCDRRSSVVA